MKKAIERLEWRFKKALKEQKGFIPNENDIAAFNEIEKQYKARRDAEFDANIYLVKLYIEVLKNRLKIANTSVFDRNIRRELLEVFKKPIHQLFDEFTKDLNESAVYEVMQELDVSITHPALVPVAQRKAENERVLQGYQENERHRKAWQGKAWNRDDVERNLRQEINALFDFLEQLPENE